MRLLRRRHARHVEVRYPQRGRRGAGEVVVAPLAAEARHRRRGVREAAQQVDGALVPAEVVDRSGDLAVLDEVDAVAGQPGEQQLSAGRPRGCTRCRSAGDPARCRPRGPRPSRRRRPRRARGCRSPESPIASSSPRCAGSGGARRARRLRIQSVRPSSSPLSKTELSLDDAEASANGVHCSPAYAGSEKSVTSGRVSSSPIRVPGTVPAEDGLPVPGIAGAG